MPAPRIPKLGILLFVVLVALDQASKIAVTRYLNLYEAIPLIGDYLRIAYVRNPGGAFSTNFGGSVFYIVVASIAASMVLAYIIFSRERNTVMQFSLFSILAGAVGNLIDRIHLGEVIDWIDVGIRNSRWPTFNVADSAIVVGLIFLIFAGSKNERKNKETESPDGDSTDPAGPLVGE